VRVDPGVVDQDVYLAEALEHLASERLDILWRADVAAADEAPSTDLLDEVLRLGGIGQVGDGDVDALFRQPPCVRLTDARGAA
jgi:hypothetical protein